MSNLPGYEKYVDAVISHEENIKALEKLNIQLGDYVRIMGKCERFSINKSDTMAWNDEKNKYIGRISKITSISKDTGCISLECYRQWSFPAPLLDKVKIFTNRALDLINPNDIIKNNSLKVGDQVKIIALKTDSGYHTIDVNDLDKITKITEISPTGFITVEYFGNNKAYHPALFEKYEESNEEARIRLNLKAGDLVKVLSKAKDRERGFPFAWNSEMDAAVGKIFPVNALYNYDGKTGVQLSINNGTRSFFFPYFVLEKVENINTAIEQEEIINISINMNNVGNNPLFICGFRKKDNQQVFLNSNTGIWETKKPDESFIVSESLKQLLKPITVSNIEIGKRLSGENTPYITGISNGQRVYYSTKNNKWEHTAIDCEPKLEKGFQLLTENEVKKLSASVVSNIQIKKRLGGTKDPYIYGILNGNEVYLDQNGQWSKDYTLSVHKTGPNFSLLSSVEIQELKQNSIPKPPVIKDIKLQINAFNNILIQALVNNEIKHLTHSGEWIDGIAYFAAPYDIITDIQIGTRGDKKSRLYIVGTDKSGRHRYLHSNGTWSLYGDESIHKTREGLSVIADKELITQSADLIVEKSVDINTEPKKRKIFKFLSTENTTDRIMVKR